MEYNQLAQWVKENPAGGQSVSDIRRWGNQYLIFFGNKYLHLNLNSNTPYLFWGDKSQADLISSKGKSPFMELFNSRLTQIKISESDRVISLQFDKVNIYNELSHYYLFAELIPRKANLILTQSNEEKHKIIDCLSYLSLSAHPERPILPGLDYSLPTAQGFSVRDNEISYPLYLSNREGKVTISSIQDNHSKEYRELNSLLKDYYYSFELPEYFRKIASDLLKSIQKNIEKKQHKLDKLNEELKDSKNSQLYKQKGELLKSNLHLVKRGMKSVAVVDFFSETAQTVNIDLHPTKSPQDNLKDYFKRYKKSINGKKMIAEQIEFTEKEIDAMARDIFEIEQFDFLDSDIKDLFALAEKYTSKTMKRFPASYITKKDKKNKQDKRANYKKITVNKDWEIFVGRTSRENDELTCRFAKPKDWWFHSRVFQGAHIILRNYAKQDLPEKLKVVCCQLAAYFSKAKHSTNVPVDYTQIRFVTKPNGSPAGFVIYKNYKSVFINPLSFRDAIVKLDLNEKE